MNGNTVGYSKQVKQVKYTELINSGHYAPVDQPDVFVALLKNWIGVSEEQEQKHITVEKI